MKEFEAHVLKIENWDEIHFDSYEHVELDEGFYCKNKLVLEIIKMKNRLRFI